MNINEKPIVKIEFFPESPADGLQSQESQSYTADNALNDFLSSLTESEDYEFNLFKYWLHNIIVDWNNKVKATNLFSANESLITVSWLKYIMNLLLNYSTNPPKLKEFRKMVKQNKKKFFNEYQVCGWKCLNDPKELRRSASSMSRSSSKITSATNAQQKDFDSKFEVLCRIFEDEFTCNFHIDLLHEATVNTFVWKDYQSKEHELHLPRGYWKIKGNKSKITLVPGPVDNNGENLDLVEQRKFLLSLMMTTFDLNEEFWTDLFVEDVASLKSVIV